MEPRLLLFFLLASIACNVSADDRPNILLLLTDDQDVVLGSFDHMPHLKTHLQDKGVTFENGFVHTPICCPSRSQILTGRYTHHGVAHNNSRSGNCYGDDWMNKIENKHTYAIHAKEAGYHTAYAGKYLNAYGYGDEKKVPPGWDRWFGLVGNSIYYNYSIIEGGIGRNMTVKRHGDDYAKDYLPDLLFNQTMKHLDELPEPWLIVLSWPSPHGPFTPAPWAKDTMAGFKAPRTESYNASSEFQEQKHWLLRQLQPISNSTAAEVDVYYQRRLETLKSVDDHIDKIMSKLDRKGQDPVVVYTSDNGFQFGQHRLAMDKRHLYENDIRVPFVVRGPGIPGPKKWSKIVVNIDIAPTFMDIIGLPEAKKGMDGISFWDYVRGKTDHEFQNRRDLLISYHGEGDPNCGMAMCPPVYDGVWWMPDSFNNTYNCVRTLAVDENSIYCRFEDDQSFVEFYDIAKNPHQLANDYPTLNQVERQKYEYRLKELLK
mmetsp:Transcript_40563/g.97973  ORF Transcript_40563/g.97973 Transcript_40563/m.97973 type:complete len:487 (-) Transcript_40563:161-1621(-)